MTRLISGIFKSRSSADLAVEDLNRHGFGPEDVSVMSADNSRGNEFVIDEHSKSPEGLAIGAAIGGIIGALLAGFMGVGMMAFPGSNWFFSGQVINALAGFGFGALIGGIIGGLIGLRIPEHEVSLYRHGLKDAGILVGVLSPHDREGEAKKVMDAAGGRLVRASSVRTERKNYERDERLVTDRRDQPPPPERYRYTS